MNKKMGRAGLCYLMVNIVSAVISFVSIAAFSNTMTTEQYGLFTNFKAWGELLVPVVGLQLSNALVPARSEFQEEGRFQRFHLSSLRLLVTIGFIFLLAGCLGGAALRASLPLIAAIVLFAFARSAMDYYNNYWVIHSRYKLYGASNLFYYIGSFSIPFLILWLAPRSDSYVDRTLGFVLAAVLAVVPVMALELRRGGRMPFSGVLRDWKYAVGISWPCIFTGLSSMALGQADRLILKALRGESEAGIYGLVYNFTVMVQMFYTAVINMWIPQFIHLYQEKEYKRLHREIGFYLSFITVISMGVFLLAPEIVRLMSPEDYWSGIPMTAFLIGGVYFHAAATFSKYVMTINKRTKSQATIMVVTTGFNIAANFLLIPVFGMTGAAFTTFCAYGLEFLMSLAVALRIHKEAVAVREMGLCTICLIAAVAANYLLLDFSLLRWGLGALLGIGWLFFQRKKIKLFFVRA